MNRNSPIDTQVKLSFVITTYKRPDLLNAAIESILAGRPFVSEVVIVDDNDPQDKYGDIFWRDIKTQLDQVEHQIIQNENNIGANQSRQNGIQALRNEDGYCLIFDDDERLSADWPKKLSVFAQRAEYHPIISAQKVSANTGSSLGAETPSGLRNWVEDSIFSSYGKGDRAWLVKTTLLKAGNMPSWRKNGGELFFWLGVFGECPNYFNVNDPFVHTDYAEDGLHKLGQIDRNRYKKRELDSLLLWLRKNVKRYYVRRKYWGLKLKAFSLKFK